MRKSVILGPISPLAGHPRSADWGLLLLRVIAGLSLALAHGWGKVPPSGRFIEGIAGMGFPAPGMFGWMVTFAEFAGGLCLAIGLLTRPAAALVAINFLVIVSMVHGGDPFGRKELPLMFLGIALCYLFAGAGRYSVDTLLFGRSGAEKSAS